MKIRKSKPEELEILLKLYGQARAFMAEHGNADQWGTAYPERSLVESDIKHGNSYVCEVDGHIAATFFFSREPDPCYERIEGGEWLNEKPYGVVHRITSDGLTKGAASYCLAWAFEQCKNVKIDTHRDNYVMQNLLKKNGFNYCGIVYMEDGTERMAYQKCCLFPYATVPAISQDLRKSLDRKY